MLSPSGADTTATKTGEEESSGGGGEEGENGEGESEVELTEDEENIKANLADAEPLPSDTLDKMLPAWWHEEPFR